MKKMCCGVLVTTPFCPSCGEKFGAVGLVSLLAYLRKNQNGAETAKKTYKKFNLDKEPRWINKRIEKWKDWADQLEALLKTEVR